MLLRWLHLDSLHRADEFQKEQNNCPRLQSCYISSSRVGVSQSLLFLRSMISLTALFERPFEIENNGVFVFEISFFVSEISTFLL